MQNPTSFQQKRPSKKKAELPKSRSTFQMQVLFNNNQNVNKPFVYRGDREVKNGEADADQQIKYLLYTLSVHQQKIHEAKIFDNRIKSRDNTVLIFYRGHIVSHAIPKHLHHLIEIYNLPVL